MGTARAAEEVLPKHINRDTLKAVRDGLDYLARTQGSDGGWHDATAARPIRWRFRRWPAWPCWPAATRPPAAIMPSRSKQVTEYLFSCSTESGLLTGPNQESGQPMHGHGFALMYLASVYGMESKPSLRTRTAEAVKKGVDLTSRGRSPDGGWSYTPGSVGDEGSVTVTQVQALRAAQNSGFLVPARHDRGGRALYRKMQDARGGHLLFARHWRRAAAGRSRPPQWPRSTTPANTTRRWPSAAWITSGAEFKPHDG